MNSTAVCFVGCPAHV